MVRPKLDVQEAGTGRFVEVDGMRAYLATPTRPSGAPGTATLLLPMITGIGERVREFASMVATGTGGPALVWDPWHGPSSDDSPFTELQRLHGELSDDTAVDEQMRLARWLESKLGATAIGVVGWCLGGRFALVLGARCPRISAVVAYHPTLPAEPPPTHTIDAVAESRRTVAPVMVHYPGRDSLVPHENFARLQDALQERDTEAASIVHLYPHAKHGFSDSARHGEQVNADAWAISWPQTLAFLTAASGVRATTAATT